MCENRFSRTIICAGSLTVLFIVLKLCNAINWSWWWVVSPIWIAMIIVAFVFVLLVVLASEKLKERS